MEKMTQKQPIQVFAKHRDESVELVFEGPTASDAMGGIYRYLSSNGWRDIISFAGYHESNPGKEIISLIKPQEEGIVAVKFNGAIYKEYQGKIYRYIIDFRPGKAEYPVTKHQPTGFTSLLQLLQERDQAEPIFPGDVIEVQF